MNSAAANGSFADATPSIKNGGGDVTIEGDTTNEKGIDLSGSPMPEGCSTPEIHRRSTVISGRTTNRAGFVGQSARASSAIYAGRHFRSAMLVKFWPSLQRQRKKAALRGAAEI
jgi:hypothetical protein